MSFTLRNSKTDFDMNNASWTAMVGLALQNGWKPQLELTYYAFNSGDAVTNEDAENMRQALIKPLCDADWKNKQTPEWLNMVNEFELFLRDGAFILL